MNFGPSDSQFKCCPGRPYSFPWLYFTPLPCEWQQPDFRPIHFGNETRFTGKTGNNCVRPAAYRYTTRVAVAAYSAGSGADRIRSLAHDLSVDRIYVVTTSPECSADFIREFERDFRVRSKVVRPYVRPSNDEEGLREFARRFLQGEITTVFP